MKSSLALTRSVVSRFVMPALLALCGAVLLALAPRASAFQQAVTVVSAATFASDSTVAPDSIVAAFGQFTTQNNQVFVATGLPLPTSLGGVQATINGVAAELIFVATTQINLVIPAGTIDGTATIIVTNSDGTTKSGNFTVVRTLPGIFMASVAMRSASAQTTNDGVNFLFTANADGTLRDVSAGSVEQPNFLILYLTGLRNAPAANPGDANGIAEGVTVTFLGVPAQVTYAGPVQGFVGLDQINVVIPPEMAGLNIINIKVLVDGGLIESNAVTIKLGGQRTPTIATPIEPDRVVTGELTYNDQLEVLGDNVYFFDAYAFNTTGNNVSVVIDLRSPAPGTPEGAPVFDPVIFLYRVVKDQMGNDMLEFQGADDQGGAIGIPDLIPSNNGCLLDPYALDNNNSLLITVLPQPGLYVLIVSSSDFNPLGIGSYTVAVRPNLVQPIAYGANIQGDIQTTDIQTSAGIYLDAFAFNGNQGDRIEATMMSQSGAFLLLQTSDGELLNFSDQNCMLPGTTASLTHQLPQAGTYLIFAYSPTLNTTGPYSLTLTRLATLAEGGPAVSGGSKASGRRLFFERRDPNGTTSAYTDSSIVDRAARRRIIH